MRFTIERINESVQNQNITAKTKARKKKLAKRETISV